MFNRFVRKKTANALIYFFYHPDDYISNGGKEANITYSYISNLIYDCKKEKLLKTEKSGRTTKINLTEKGEDIAKLLIKLKDQLGDTNG